MSVSSLRRCVGVLALSALAAAAPAAGAPAATAPAIQTRLPDETPYQQELRKFLGSLTEKDFEHAVKEPPKVVSISNPDDLYRTWLLSLEFPRVGMIMHGGRNAAGVSLPASQFTLATIEDSKQGVLRPAIWPEPTAWLANWNYPGNPYYGSRALKLRAFVTATVDMLMMDDRQQHSTLLMHLRSDWFGPHLVMYGYTYAAVRDVIPPAARAAYEACLKTMMRRVSARGPQGDEGYFDICAVLGMRLAANAVNDPESSKIAEAYAKRFFNDPWYYNSAGYFPEQGCYDAGFNGLSLYWATWLALAAPDWPFVQEAVKKSWRLRGYLVLPEPDGALLGASHFNSRTGSDVVKDQWDWPFRVVAASFLTDDAACQARFPTGDELKAAAEAAVLTLKPQVLDYPGNPNMQRLTSGPWRWQLYPDTFDFPTSNYAFDYYPKGYFAHREDLARANSPLLKYPFQRGDTFVEAFAKVFLIAKKPTFGVVVHSGPVSEFQGEGHVEFTGPYGLSGGSLSAFWTPATGAVILGRRSGMQFPDRTPASFDLPEAWRTWPVHAVSGATPAPKVSPGQPPVPGKFFTSARIQNPEAVYTLDKAQSTVKVAGTIPAVTIGTEKVLKGKIDYSRTFALDDKGLSVETTVSGDGQDTLGELYEVLPVFLREAMLQPKAVPTTIEFECGGKWVAATDAYLADVQAVRLTRFKGSVVIRFDRPRRVKLSPADWTDSFLTRATCRNVLVDLLESGDKPTTVKDARTVGYRIEPVTK